MKVSKRIRSRIEDLGIHMSEAALRSGLSYPTFWRIANGRKAPDVTLAQIGVALEIPEFVRA